MKFLRALRLTLPLLVLAGHLRGAAAGLSGSDQVNPAARATFLRAEIRRHDDLYFRHAAPEITDAAYDDLRRELASLDQASAGPEALQPAALPPGDDRDGRHGLARHGQPMLSLDKCYSEVELRAFYARLVRQLGGRDVTCVVEPKFDGVAVSVTYERGRLVRVVTRGDGSEGDDVTERMRGLESLPGELRARATDGSPNRIPDRIELRGEVYLPLPEFARLNRERESAGEPPYAHPRTLAASTLKQREVGAVAARGLAIVFYGCGVCEPASLAPPSQQALHRCIRAWGLPGMASWRTVRDADELWLAVQAFGRERSKVNFPSDGSVVKVDAAASRQVLGATDHAPRWATAYKYAPERAETRLRSIICQVGRTGAITPIGRFDPILLGGAMVSQASLYSRAEIVRRDYRVGDVVTVEKAGDVIPTLAGVKLECREKDAPPFEFPTACPSCDTALASEGDGLVRCPNEECPAQVRRRLQHFVSAAAVDIPGLGPARIETLVAHVGVKAIGDLYRLRREELTAPGVGWGDGRIVDQLLAAIEHSKHAALWRFIHGLGIPHVGLTAARELAQRFGSLSDFAETKWEDSTKGDARIEGVRPAVISALHRYFAEPRHRQQILELSTLGVRPALEEGGSRGEF